MTGVVRRVVTRYYRGGTPLEDALKDFHTHTYEGHEVVFVCMKCESARVRNNVLGGDQFEGSAPNAEYSCLDCGTAHEDVRTLEAVPRREFESQVVAEYNDAYN
jgi:hypothetical protein